MLRQLVNSNNLWGLDKRTLQFCKNNFENFFLDIFISRSIGEMLAKYWTLKFKEGLKPTQSCYEDALKKHHMTASSTLNFHSKYWNFVRLQSRCFGFFIDLINTVRLFGPFYITKRTREILTSNIHLLSPQN